MKTLYFDLLCGASGDMIVSSLLDLGVPASYLVEQLGRLRIDGLSVETEHVKRGGIRATRLALAWDEQRSLRHLHSILALIQSGGYSQTVNRRCEETLKRIAVAEARVHGVDVEKVHFHEVGAVDTIIDVCGTCLALEYLGIERILFSTLTVGHGTITGEHGVMPVPCPAVAEMARGFAIAATDVPTEILTPTGCALLTALGEQATGGYAGVVARVGYGCGTREFAQRPNLLRAILIDADTASGDVDAACLLETDIDHCSGEQMGFAAESLFTEGALDVSWMPVFMKKGRPGYRLTVMAPESLRETMIDALFRHTRTLGIRQSTVRRAVARRGHGQSTVDGMTVEEKWCASGDMAFIKPEYESLAALARREGVSLFEAAERWHGQRREKGSGDEPRS